MEARGWEALTGQGGFQPLKGFDVGNVVCLVNNAEGSLDEVMRALDDIAHE